MTVLNYESLKDQFIISMIPIEDFRPPSEKIETSYSSYKDYQLLGHPFKYNINKEDKYNVQKKK